MEFLKDFQKSSKLGASSVYLLTTQYVLVHVLGLVIGDETHFMREMIRLSAAPHENCWCLSFSFEINIVNEETYPSKHNHLKFLSAQSPSNWIWISTSEVEEMRLFLLHLRAPYLINPETREQT